MRALAPIHRRRHNRPMQGKDVCTLILAAGKGKRMQSDLPKVLIPVLGRPMVAWVVDTCHRAGVGKIVLIVGHGREQVRQTMGNDVHYAVQDRQLGTGHAVQMAVDACKGWDWTLVLNGDCPLITPGALQGLFDAARAGADLAFLTIEPSSPQAYGRVLRSAAGKVTGVVEVKDATKEQLAIREMNGGMYLFRTAPLVEHLEKLSADNAQGEYYITDLVKVFLDEGLAVEGVVVDEREVLGANTPDDVKVLEKILSERNA